MFSVIKLASKTLTENYNPTLFNYFHETYPEGFIVAEKNHKIIGFIIGINTSPRNTKILMLSISETHRRQKIGSELLKQFLKKASENKIKNIKLEVRIDNNQAIKFYQKNDFKITGKIPKFYQNGEDAYTMEKNI